MPNFQVLPPKLKFATDPPFAAVANGAARGIPLLCGTNLDETKFHRAIDPAIDTLDEGGLLARCHTIWPTAGQAEYTEAQQARAS